MVVWSCCGACGLVYWICDAVGSDNIGYGSKNDSYVCRAGRKILVQEDVFIIVAIMVIIMEIATFGVAPGKNSTLEYNRFSCS